MLSESEILRSWRSLFHRSDYNEQIFARAEALLEELRPENPLRHRLSAELFELRRRQPKQSASR